MSDKSKIAKPHRYAGRSAKRLGISKAEYITKFLDGQKWCSSCCSWHAQSDFGRDSQKWDGLRHACKKTFKVPVKRHAHGKPMLGKKHSQETKQRIRETHLGSSNHRWKGGVTPAQRRARQNAAYQRWRKAILRRDENRCRECGLTGHLNVHHIKPFKNHPQLRTDPNNGITLCESCHKKIHAEKEHG